MVQGITSATRLNHAKETNALIYSNIREDDVQETILGDVYKQVSFSCRAFGRFPTFEEGDRGAGAREKTRREVYGRRE